MTTGAATLRQPEEQYEELAVWRKGRTETLSECVNHALRFYLRNLDGHEVNDLHRMVIGEVERPLLETVLDHTKGNQTLAARLLGLSRGTLRKKMAQHGIGKS